MKIEVGAIPDDIVISDTVKIGMKCKVGHFSKIGKNCRIGNNVTIGDSVTIEQNTMIGNNCRFQSGIIIGADGLSYERDEHSFELERFPHIGGVKIGDNVEVSSNCSIARGSLSDTIIGDGTKLDALVHIAHNVEIGRNCVLAAGTIVGGSTKIGDASWCGLNCTIKHKLRIGTSVTIGNGSSVINDVPDGEIVEGVPAKSIKHKVGTKQPPIMT
jgi:UDP-3-O-[3-hydroxymyristoyl] glucosamine N-acyltransferase